MKLSNNNNIKIFQWNARSIDKNINYLIQHLSENNYHLLLIQSLNVNLYKLPKLSGYFYPPIINHVKKDEKIKTCKHIKYIYTHI